MAKYRHELPQLGDDLFLTDGGLETTLLFHDGIDLPEFAAFVLLNSEEGRETISGYFHKYAEIARKREMGFILESPTWRASTDWGMRLGYTQDDLDRVNQAAIELMAELRDAHESDLSPFVISGCVGPRGDGYAPEATMSPIEAERYHRPQIMAFRDAGADFVTAITMNYVEEALGIARAAAVAGMPSVISFTVETDGFLPTGESLREAIEAVDAATGPSPAYYMINCAHPTHFAQKLMSSEPWVQRIRGLRANASCMSHAELDCMTELDDGNPVQLGREYKDIVDRLGQITVLGGCCGTDHRHVDAIAAAVARPAARSDRHFEAAAMAAPLWI